MAPLSGMTGFARVSGEASWGSWAWEARSVNGRTLDVRVTLPPGFEALDRPLRAAASRAFTRGSLQLSLRIDMTAGPAGLRIDEDLLAGLSAALRKAHGEAPSSAAIATLMTLRGVVEQGTSNLRDIAADDAALASLGTEAEAALAGLERARLEEGRALSELLGNLIGEMEAYAAAAGKLAGAQPELIRVRLIRQLDDLDRDGRVDAERFAVEAALNAARADVREELDRLAGHFVSARALLAGGSPAGRKLDFLAQELNREANTLCSKSISLDLTNAGLGLKGVIDQFKEQAANVE